MNKILATTYCSTCAAKELTVDFEAKCEFSSSSDIGDFRTLFTISGTTPTANRWAIFIDATGELYNFFYGSSLHWVGSAADPVDYSEWHRYTAYINVSDLSLMNLYIDGTSSIAASSGNNGTDTLNTSAAYIRLGMDYDSVVNTYCKYKNLRIYNKRVAP